MRHNWKNDYPPLLRFCGALCTAEPKSLARNVPTRCENWDERICLPTSSPRQELHSHSSRRVKITKVLVCNRGSGPASRVLRSGLCGTSLCGTITYKVSIARGISRVRWRFREDLFMIGNQRGLRAWCYAQLETGAPDCDIGVLNSESSSAWSESFCAMSWEALTTMGRFAPAPYFPDPTVGRQARDL